MENRARWTEKEDDDVEIPEKAITLDDEPEIQTQQATQQPVAQQPSSGVTINLYNTPQPTGEGQITPNVEAASVVKSTESEESKTADEMQRIIDQKEPLKISKMGSDSEEKSEEEKEKKQEGGTRTVTFN